MLFTLARAPRAVMTFGSASLVVGVAITLLSIGMKSTPVFFVGAIVSGIGFGAAFQGAIRSVLSLAAPRERAGVLSVLYIVAYLAMGLPAVLGGVRVVYGDGVLSTAREYGVAVIALATIALLATPRRARTARTARETRATLL